MSFNAKILTAAYILPRLSILQVTLMKLIFTADTHFGCKFLNENADLRNAELIRSFNGIADFAERNSAPVLLGGDMFDTPFPDEQTAAAVRRVFETHPKTDFYAVCGNHDPLYTTEFYFEPPKNLFVFPERITKVELSDIALYGVSLTAADLPDPWQGFHADGKFITLSHGTLSGMGGFELDPVTLADTGARLSLLGHIHLTSRKTLYNGSHALYAGAPFGHGFDECGQKGYYLIDTEDLSYTFINTDAKLYSEYTVDVSECASISDVLDRLSAVTPTENEIARAVLTGAPKVPLSIDCDSLCEYTDGFVKIKDKTQINEELFKAVDENTLEGAFVSILTKKLKNAEGADRQIILDAMKEGISAIRSGK